jgi:IS4 transposase
LEVSLISIVDVEANQSFALSAEQTPPQPTTKKKEKTETRIDFYLEHLRKTAPDFPAAVKYGVFDGAYAKLKFVTGVCAAGYHMVSKLRVDAQLLYRYTGEQRRRKYDGKVDFTDLSRFEKLATAEVHLTLYTGVVWSVSLKRPIRAVVVVNRKEKEKPRYVVLFATDTELAAPAIFRYYKARFQIEFLFRDAKQFAGFSDCQARDKEALHFHFNASVTLVNLARHLAQAEQKTEEKFVFSMASLKQRFFNDHLLNLIISKLALDQTVVKNHPQFEYLRNYAAIAA